MDYTIVNVPEFRERY